MDDVRGRMGLGGEGWRRGGARALRWLGFGVIAAGLLFGGSFAWVTGGAVGLVVGLAAIGAGATAGALLVRAGARHEAGADDEERRRRELAILRLAEARGGTLTVTDLSQSLELSAAESEAALDAMADGSRVTAEITSDGRVEYVFREVVAAKGRGVRVELAEPVAAEPAETELAPDREHDEALRRRE